MKTRTFMILAALAPPAWFAWRMFLFLVIFMPGMYLVLEGMDRAGGHHMPLCPGEVAPRAYYREAIPVRKDGYYDYPARYLDDNSLVPREDLDRLMRPPRRCPAPLWYLLSLVGVAWWLAWFGVFVGSIAAFVAKLLGLKR